IRLKGVDRSSGRNEKQRRGYTRQNEIRATYAADLPRGRRTRLRSKRTSGNARCAEAQAHNSYTARRAGKTCERKRRCHSSASRQRFVKSGTACTRARARAPTCIHYAEHASHRGLDAPFVG